MSGIVLKGYKHYDDSPGSLVQEDDNGVLSSANDGYLNGDLNDGKSAEPQNFYEVKFAPDVSDPTNHAAVSPEMDNQDDKSNKKKKKEKVEKPPMIPFSTLFRYANGCDKFLMFIGVIMALLHGAIIPVSFIMFGELTDDFIDFAKQQGALMMVSGNNTNNTQAVKPMNIKDQMATFAIYYIILAVGNFIVAYGQITPWAWTSERLTFRIRKALFRSVMRQNIGWFDVHDAGEINSRLTEDVSKIHNGIGDKIALLMQCITVFFGGFIIGFIYGPKLTAVIIALTPVIMIIGGVMSKLITGLTSNELDSYAKAGSIAEEVISSIRTVAAFGGEQKECKRYSEHLGNARDSGIKKGFNTGMGFGMLNLVIFGCYALAFWYGAKLIIDGEMTGGQLLIVFFGVLTGAFQAGQAGPYMEAVATARGAGYKVFEIIDRVPPIDSSSTAGESPDMVKGDISFENVDFFYPSRPDVQVLNNMSVNIPSGKTVALVGESGCGKSTTTKLILRFYDPHSGVIKLDGKDIRDLNLKWLRNHIGVVSQEPVLFATTITENIRYGHEGVTQEQIEAAAKAANAHSFIVNFPQGYDTLVGERGAQMSGGQKQRIAIARALVRDPKILLLDEATSALDTESEGIVQAALDKAREGRTTIVIAHRLSTVRTADSIAAFQDGLVVEQGTHDELMQINGVYNQLVTMQTFNAEEENEGDNDQDPEDKEIAQEVKFFRSLSNMSSTASERETQLERQLSHRLSRKLSAGKRKRTVSEKSVDQNKKGVTVEEEKVEPTPFFRILKLNLPEWPLLLLGLFGAALNGVFPMAFSLIFGEILAVFALADEDKMRKESTFWSLMFLVLGVLSFIGNFMQNYFFARSGEILTMRLRASAFKAILRQDIEFFDDPKHTTGALTTNLSTHASEVKGAAGLRLGSLSMTVVMALGCLILAFVSGWKLTLVMIAFIPLLVVTGIIQMKQITGDDKTAKECEESGKVAVETVENIHTVVTLGKEETFFHKYETALLPTYKKGIKDAHVFGISFGLSESAMFLCNAAAFYYGGVLVQDGEMTFDGVMKVVIAVMIGAMTAGNMSAATPDYVKAKIAATHIINLFDLVPKIDHESLEGKKLDLVTGSLEVRNVVFRYPTRPDQKVLRNLNLSVKPGQTLALVGSSGCGKSTVVSLLERFYDAEMGTLCIDGHDVKTCNIQWLRSQIGIVSQEPVLFDCSIRDNIAYGDNTRTFTQAEIETAAKSANIHSFIASLPEGYNTMVGDKGTLISGGQKQRIAIARALIRNPRILLLDEATSALDAESEKVVQEALDAASEGRTCIVIAHRLSTIQNADKIAVIHSGKVVEQGKHQELLAMKGTYYLLNVGQT